MNRFCPKCKKTLPYTHFAEDWYWYLCKDCKPKIDRNECSRKYYHTHKAERRIYSRVYRNARRKKDLRFRIMETLRCRLVSAIKNHAKRGSAVRDLGCSIEEFKLYIESKFKPGMSWNNWGKHTWHLDHIVPLCSFNLENRNELLKACHYSNLQPLWAHDNCVKSGKHVS